VTGGPLGGGVAPQGRATAPPPGSQLDLLGGETPLHKLGPRQQLVLDELHRIHPDPITTDEAGALVHAARGNHGAGDRCQWCGSEGQDVLRRLSQLGHAIRRRGASGYTLRRAPASESAQTDDIPF
jgi:hypothetical protein